MPIVAPDPSFILGSTGPIAASLGPSFESRPEQAAMAAAVAATLEKKGRLLVEAGTGVGKSFAYLVPAIIRCLTRGERIVIATNTIALQEQLISKDIPLLQATIDAWGFAGGDKDKTPLLIPVLVKGRANYVSVRRLRLASQRQAALFSDAQSFRSLHQIEDWAIVTRDGTLSTLPTLEAPEVWDHARSDADNCMGRKCPNFKECFYQAARAQMERANLLVCNHALFFSDLALRTRLGESAAVLPAYHHIILDEAHNIEDATCEYFGLSLTQARISRLLRTLYNPRRQKGYLTERSLSVGDTESIDRAIRLVNNADEASRQFFDDLLHLYERDPSGNGRLREKPEMDNPLTPALRELSLRLKSLRDGVESEQDKFEINSYAKRASDIAETAVALLDQTLPDCVYWIESQHAPPGGDPSGGGGWRARRPRITIACSPIDAAPILREHLFSREAGIVMTSATLATRAARKDEHKEHAETAFAYLINQLGCEGGDTLQLGSPFDYASQLELYIDTTCPNPRESGYPDAPRRSRRVNPSPEPDVRAADEDTCLALDPLSRRILDHVRATRGGAFVLFTSFATLNSVADALQSPLARENLPLLIQNRSGSRAHILESFRNNPNSVLLGAASFWQGVDVRGETLRNVIITRLPFEPPDRPLTQARLERITQRKGNAFMEDSLPRAVIRFKQGFGRLIRSKTDTGRVVVLDPRILTARYGQRFLNALPPGLTVRTIE